MTYSNLRHVGHTLNDKVIAVPLMSFQTLHRENQWATEEHDEKIAAKRGGSRNRKDYSISNNVDFIKNLDMASYSIIMKKQKCPMGVKWIRQPS